MADWINPSTTRRTFLAAVILPSIGASLGVSACGDVDRRSASDIGGDAGIDAPSDTPVDVSLDVPGSIDVAALVSAYFGDASLDAVRAIGRSYIRDFDDGMALEQDMTLLLGPLEAVPGGAMVGVVEALVAADLDANRVSLLEGWTIAPSELRMCALAEAFS